MSIERPIENERAREIELELVRVRSAAEVARLEARAAELELLLRRLLRGDPFEVALHDTQAVRAVKRSDDAYASIALSAQARGPLPLKAPPDPPVDQPDPWLGRLLRLRARDESHHTVQLDRRVGALQGPALASALRPSAQSTWSPHPSSWQPNGTPDKGDETLLPQMDSPLAALTASHFGRADLEREQPAPSPGAVSDGAVSDGAVSDGAVSDGAVSDGAVSDGAVSDGAVSDGAVSDGAVATRTREVEGTAPGAGLAWTRRVNARQAASSEMGACAKRTPRSSTLVSPVGPAKHVEPARVAAVLPDCDSSKPAAARRVRPASWLLSMLAHLVILLLLGAMTLANTTPKDQVALTAAVSETNEDPMETIAIESPQPKESEATTAETVYEVSPVGTLAIDEVPLDLPPATAAMTTSDLLGDSVSPAERLSLKSSSDDSPSKMQFCGVDGGGNHFVYLVDSSGSMKEGFHSARTELLASIDQLRPNQRFYVVFFDEEPEYMRLQDPNVDEPASVTATPENKLRLRKWAMKVQMNPGRAPYEVLPFALKLRPDVIFLLSDGEFPGKIGDILRAQNHQENLFGESGPICLVHTIRYHGMEGETGRQAEATMVKIAKENGGQYRHVPKPR